MDDARVKNSVAALKADITRCAKVLEKGAYAFEEEILQFREDFAQDTQYRLAKITFALFPYLKILTVRANIGLYRLTIHASPEMIVLLLFVVKIISIIKFIAVVVSVVKILSTIWVLNNIVRSLFPRYRDWFDALLRKVSEVSEVFGWGTDGISHILNAVSGGINIVGGLLGKDWNVMQLEMMTRSQQVLNYMSIMAKDIANDPAFWIDRMFYMNTLYSANDVGEWWQNTSKWITAGMDKAETAINGVREITGELLAIQNNMPEVVRRNIPSQIWGKLNQFDIYITYKILPNFDRINRTLSTVDSMLDSLGVKASELADKLAHPGEILLGVDNLPGYAKAAQLGQIDDVTSREFEAWTNQERLEVQSDLNDFDRIDRLLKAPTPEPGFLTLEVLPGKTIRGITAEPKETWFPGGYNDPR